MTPRIITITLNPAIDHTIFVDRFTPGKVNRATDQHRQAGGKGVNVSALLGNYGIRSIATGFLGEENQQDFIGLFALRGVDDEFIRLHGETRTGVKLIDRHARETTDINLPGLQPTDDDFGKLKGKLAVLVRQGDWVVIAGSLPGGFGIGNFKELLELVRKAGAKIAVDASDEALHAAIEFGVDLIKPNEHELADCLGIEDRAALVDAAIGLQRERIGQVILSLGGEGAWFITQEGVCKASAPPVAVVSTVGAGDALLAGYLAGIVDALPLPERAKLATVFAGAVLENFRRILPSREDIEKKAHAIEVE